MEFPRYILAPYVATPPEVVERMVALAGVTADDVVWDLGCGDGRTVIAAARSRGCRGRGVDIEPYWVEQARANAEAAGVGGLVTFEAADALAVDPRDATVVFLYLVHWSTRLVAEHLFARVAPGTRIVSHSFPLDGVPPAASESVVDAEGKRREIYMWVAGE